MKTIAAAATIALAALLGSQAAARNFLDGAASGMQTRSLLEEDAQFCGELGEPPCPETGCAADFEESSDGLCQFHGADSSTLRTLTTTGRSILETVVSLFGTSTNDGSAPTPGGTFTVTINGVDVVADDSPPAPPTDPPTGGYGGTPPVMDPPAGMYGGPPPIVDPPVSPSPTPPASTVCAGTCARNNRQCAGLGIDGVRACCSSDYACVRRNEDYSQCRLGGEPGLVRWEGTILTCTPAR